ncbi:MAG: hypothetical protein JWO22_3442 [Frankiales bacterium]|nr:hypothetical protein [Frankiales bacterium]
MRKLALLAAAAIPAAVTLPLLTTATGSAAAERHCYTPHVAGFDSYEVCYFLPIEPTTQVQAQSLIPELPDPTDCHSMNRFLHIDNVRSCDDPPVS